VLLSCCSSYANHVFAGKSDSDDDAFQQHVTAKSVPRFAHNNLKRARSWIETCKSSHESCRQFHLNTVRHDRQRPTRVLEINGSLVRLRCNMTNEPVDYLVVSHMWGKPSSEHDGPLQLTLSNLRELRGAVPWCKLSPIYREAIRVTNVLGYRYLWIDSLCIIQDSAEDWKHEARLMARSVILYGFERKNILTLCRTVSTATPHVTSHSYFPTQSNRHHTPVPIHEPGTPASSVPPLSITPVSPHTTTPPTSEQPTNPTSHKTGSFNPGGLFFAVPGHSKNTS
jgi:hypothetical protein